MDIRPALKEIEFLEGRLSEALKRANDAAMQRDYLVELLANEFGWMDDSYAHAVGHVHNAIANLRSNQAVKIYERLVEICPKAGFTSSIPQALDIVQAEMSTLRDENAKLKGVINEDN